MLMVGALYRAATRGLCTSAPGATVVAASSIVRSPFPDVVIPDVGVHEMLWRDTVSWHDRTALECAETGRRYTFEETRRATTALAGALRQRLRLQRGHVLAVALPNSPEFCVALLAALRAGLTVTTVNPAYTAAEVARQLRDSGARALVAPAAEEGAAARQAAGALPVVAVRLRPGDATPPGALCFGELCAGLGAAPDLGEEGAAPGDTALLPYSSGTTGVPKGVRITGRNLVAQLCQMHAPDVAVMRRTDASHQDVVPAVLPLFHAYGLVLVFLGAFACGARLVTLPRFTAASLAALLAAHRPSLLHAAPPLVHFLNGSAAVRPSAAAALRAVMCGAAPLSAADVDRFRAKFGGGARLLQGYGLTEASPLVTMQRPADEEPVRGACGWPIPNTECTLAPGTGELWVRGPQVAAGYHAPAGQQPAQLADAEGWLRTGDVARCDNTGQFTVTERLKELIKVKGLQVAPAELEALLRQHPAVADAAVVGVPHDRLGEAPRAFLVPRPGLAVPRAQDIHAFLEGRVAPFKRLAGGVTFVDAIPISPSGKVLRRLLRDM